MQRCCLTALRIFAVVAVSATSACGWLETVKVAQLVTLQGSGAPVSFDNPFERVEPDGTLVPFTLPAGTVLVITDVQCKSNHANLPGGIYRVRVFSGSSAGLGRTANLECWFDTTTEGFSKTMSLTTGTVFSDEPTFTVLVNTPAPVGVKLYGYMMKR